MRIKTIVATIALSVGCALPVAAASIANVSTDVVPGEWTSSFNAAVTYAEANGVPMLVIWSNPGCAHCNSVKAALNSAEFVTWRQNRKIILVVSEGDAKVKAWIKRTEGTGTLTGKFPFFRIHWPAGNVDFKFNGYPTASIPGSGSTIQAKVMNCVDGRIVSWINGGGDPGSGTSVTPVTPTPTPSTPTVGTEWKKARILYGSYYDAEGALAGRITVSAGRASAKGVAKVKASFMGLDGRSRTITAKPFTVNTTTSGTISSASGKYEFSITGASISGKLTVGGETYEVKNVQIGGDIPAGNYTFSLDAYPETCQGYPVIMPDTLLPFSQDFTVSAKKWSFPRKSLKLTYDGATDSFVATKVSNPSGLKLSYTAKTGFVKGKLTLNTRNGKRVKRYTATVTGFMVGAVGSGNATIKKVGAYPWTIGAAK